MVDRAICRRVVVITPEQIYTGEIDVIEHIVSRGGFVHIRKPNLSQLELDQFCRSLLGDRNQMTIHYNHSLSQEQRFGGSHVSISSLNSYPDYLGRLTTSCHTANEALAAEESVASYYFISPVFDSISKRGYKAAFSDDKLIVIKNSCKRAVALGGVNYENLNRLTGFNSIALLGAVWVFEDGRLNKELSIESFDKIFDYWSNLK